MKEQHAGFADVLNALGHPTTGIVYERGPGNTTIEKRYVVGEVVGHGHPLVSGVTKKEETLIERVFPGSYLAPGVNRQVMPLTPTTLYRARP